MEPRFENRYFSQPKMLAEFARKYSMGPSWPALIAFWISYVVLLAVAIWASLSTTSFVLIIGFGIGMLYVAFLPQIFVKSSFRNAKKQNDGVLPETVTTFGDTIEIHEGMLHMSIEYRKIVKVLHLKHSYMLMLGKRNGVMLDPNGFTKGTFEEFKQFLREMRPDLKVPE